MIKNILFDLLLFDNYSLKLHNTYLFSIIFNLFMMKNILFDLLSFDNYLKFHYFIHYSLSID